MTNSPSHQPTSTPESYVKIALNSLIAYEPDERSNLQAQSVLDREAAVGKLRPLNFDPEVAKAIVEIMCDAAQPESVRQSARAALQGSDSEYVAERIQLEMDFEMIGRHHYDVIGRGGYRKSEFFDEIEAAITRIQTRNSEPDVAARLLSILGRDDVKVARCLQGTKDPGVLEFAKKELKAACEDGFSNWPMLAEVVPILLINTVDQEAKDLLVRAITSDKLPPFKYQNYVAQAASRDLGPRGVEAMRIGIVDIRLHRSDTNFPGQLSVALREGMENDPETQAFLEPLVSGSHKHAARYLVRLETERNGRKAGREFARELKRGGVEALIEIRVAAARALFDVSENARAYVEEVKNIRNRWHLVNDLTNDQPTNED